MSASHSHLATSRPPIRRKAVWPSPSRPIVVATVLGVVGLLNAIGLLVVLRRLSGAFSNDLPREAMLLTALVATAAVACARIAWRRNFPFSTSNRNNKKTGPWNWDSLVGWGSSSALLLLAVGCCYPANHTSDWLIWLPPLVADQFWRQTFFDAGHLNNTAYGTALGNAKELTAAAPELQTPAPEAGISTKAEKIVQQLFRVRDDAGREVIYGTLRADFKVGQRTAVMHVGFCPPLSHLPEVEAESLPGSAARIKVVQALAHGTRMDVRLPSPAKTDCHLWIDMAATPSE